MDEDLREISNLLANTDDSQRIYSFLNALLTPNEVEEISKRWALLKLLDLGMSQRSIASELGISLCKITRGSKELQKKDSIMKYFINFSRGMKNGEKTT